MSDNIQTDLNQGVWTITLNRPDRLNSFNETMHKSFSAALKEAKKNDQIRCVVITGAGRGFCAGQDLSDRNVSADEARPDLGYSLDRFYNPHVQAITQTEKPFICAVNGVAAGAGSNLAMAADIVFAAESASFIQSFGKIGLVPDSGGTWILPRLVGLARAKALALLGDKLSAQQAEDWGLIWKCLPDEALQAEAHALAQQLAQGPTRGYGLTKRALNASTNNTLNQQLDLERDLQSIAGQTDDYREGVAAFIEKRSPKYYGR